MNLKEHLFRIVILAALAAPVAAMAQEAGMDSVAAAFSRYQGRTTQEKLFAHVDRTLYLAGETIWFRLYDIDGQSNRPAALSGIAYIEVLDRDQHPILQTKVELKDGKGDGALSIPLSVSSGEFLFRAYTSWMRNFSPDLYYMQPLTILNTLTDSSAAPATDTGHAGLRLFPEGGNLVSGLTSVIAVETTDRHGQSISCEGAILGQNRDTVARFHTGASGVGRFLMAPAAGNSYVASTMIDGQVVTQPLPSAYDQGYVMHLEDQDEHRIRVTVRKSGASGPPVVYLFAHTHGATRAVRMSYFTDGAATFELAKDSLGAGISHLTVFDSDRTPVCERLFFKPPTQTLHIGINTGAATFATRSLIPVQLSGADKAGSPLAADLSLAVFRLDSLQPIPGDNILTWLLLGSELKGPINIPPVNDWATNPASAAALDDLMLTRGWSRYRWEDILADHKAAFEFIPEINGPVITARVVDKQTGQPPRQTIGYLSLPGQHFQLATALSRPDGTLQFHLEPFYGIRAVIAQTNPEIDSNLRVDVAAPWSDRFAPFALPGPGDPVRWASQLLQRSIDAQSENAYLSAKKHRFVAMEEDSIPFYGTADLRYNLDDYVRFATMEEVIQEFVDNVRVRRRSGHAYFRVKNALFNLFFEGDPLLLIDGIPVFNPDKLMSTDPAKIRKIEVVSHKYIFGPSVTDGVVSFKSYDGEFGGYELDPNAVAIQYNGLDRHREFYTPVYTAEDKGQPSIPDFRNELIWAPEIVVDTTGKKTVPVYTSDKTGRFLLVVQGMTKEGLAGYSTGTFTVGQ